LKRPLFLYGVLREDVGDWPFLKGLGLGSPVTTDGVLYAIPDPRGWYPALLLTQARFSYAVHGMIHDASAIDMAAVDAFEGSNYARQSVPVDGWSGYSDTEAEAYVWTAELPQGAVMIPEGDFAAWLVSTGHTAYAGD